jgi:hypothetical protein
MKTKKDIESISKTLQVKNIWGESLPEFPAEMPPTDDFPNWFQNHEPLARILKPDMLVCEIGAWVGHSTHFFAERCETVITMDVWANSEEEYQTYQSELVVWGKAKRFIPFIYLQFLKNCWDLKDKIFALKMKSCDALPLIHEKGIKPDLFYVDGEHYYNAAIFDISTVLTLFPDSICCGDDIVFESVEKALKECAEKFNKTLEVEGNFWILK